MSSTPPHATIEIEREPGAFAKLRDFQVLIDGQRVGSLATGARKSFRVTAERHRVMVMVDFVGSQELTVDASQDGGARLKCAAVDVGPIFVWYSIFHRTSLIDLVDARGAFPIRPPVASGGRRLLFALAAAIVVGLAASAVAYAVGVAGFVVVFVPVLIVLLACLVVPSPSEFRRMHRSEGRP